MACKLYLITPPQFVLDDFISQLKDVIEENNKQGKPIAALQVRCKIKNKQDKQETIDETLTKKTALAIAPLLKQNQIALLINDEPNIAKQVGADGAHLGQDDTDYETARHILGHNAIIGITCHNSRHLAFLAGEKGANYVAFGSFFTSNTKPTAQSCDLNILKWWQKHMRLPCLAIGGITPNNAPALIKAGADFLAVSQAIWGHKLGAKQGLKAFAEILHQPYKETITQTKHQNTNIEKIKRGKKRQEFYENQWQ